MTSESPGTPVLLGVDVGTSDSKVLVTTVQGQEITSVSTPTSWRNHGGSFTDTDPEALVAGVFALLESGRRGRTAPRSARSQSAPSPSPGWPKPACCSTRTALPSTRSWPGSTRAAAAEIRQLPAEAARRVLRAHRAARLRAGHHRQVGLDAFAGHRFGRQTMAQRAGVPGAPARRRSGLGDVVGRENRSAGPGFRANCGRRHWPPSTHQLR